MNDPKSEIVAKTPPAERVDIDHGTRVTEYRARRVSDAERNERWQTYDNTPFAVERRTIKTNEDTGEKDEGEWAAFATGATKRAAIEDGIGDTGFLLAISCDPLHEEIVAGVKALRAWQEDKSKRVKEAIQEARWRGETAFGLKEAANKKYRTALKRAGLFELAGQNKADQSKIDAIKEKLLGQVKPEFDRAMELQRKADALVKEIEAEIFPTPCRVRRKKV